MEPVQARVTEPTAEERANIERRFIWIATATAVLLAAIPALYAQIAAPKGSTYLGFEYNTDDHMVYAAWMRQAMDGRFLFDNRFTTDAQPGLTVHIYFWLLGLIAKVTGIPLAANLGRLVFTGLFVPLLYRLVRQVSTSVFMTRLAVALTVLGGGVGFMVWHNFGRAIVRPTPEPIANLMLGKLPIDVWQPEAFVFPSMLTNGLFMVSLCLILVVFQTFLDAREGWKPVLWGGLALGVLMNIHSYDVLTIAFVMVGFVAMQLGVRQLTGAWLLKGLIIGTGALPAALWFIHVLHSDQVFQARAATPTYSADFRQVFFGYIFMMGLALPGLFIRFKSLRFRIGIGALAILMLGLFLAAPAGAEGYFLNPPQWGAVAFLALGCLVLLATDSPTLNLLLAWAVMGLVALYFPALFQRKLSMGLSVPWAILATLGFAEIVRGRDRSARNLATILVVLVLAATSLFWLTRREPYLIRHDVSSTTVHPVFLNHDEREIVRMLAGRTDRSRVVAIAMPGAPSPEVDGSGQRIPDEYSTPAIPDLNPLVSGLTGVYTYAGHWSETPDYANRRNEVTKVFLADTPPAERAALLSKIHPDYIVEPSTETYGHQIQDLSSLGDLIYSGSQFKLIRVKR